MRIPKISLEQVSYAIPVSLCQTASWIKKDYHVHESYSADAPGATVERFCRMAERRGIDEIAFTTHLILRGPDVEVGVSPDKITEYTAKIDAAQEATSVNLRAGLEIDYFPQEERRIEGILEEHSLDYVLGSLHYVRGYDIGSRRGSSSFFSGRKLGDALDVYFEGWKEAVESGLFDVMAHPDYFRRYLAITFNNGVTRPIRFDHYGSDVYDVMDSLKSYGVGVEVNSSGYRHNLEDVYPVTGFIRAMMEAGVDKVTVGSDCHTVEGLGENTIKAVNRLEEAGYTHLCIYINRKNEKIQLSEVKIN